MKSYLLNSGLMLAVTLSIVLSSCEKSGEDLPGEPVPINLTLKQESLIASENEFAFDIFQEVIKSSSGENVIISPLSISYALSMTVNGAANATRDSILKALRVSNTSIDELNSSYKDLTSALLSIDKRVQVDIANSVWTENSFIVRQPFIDVLSGYYDAEARSFDINDATAPSIINKWIEDHTNGLIKNMIDRLNDNTVMLLINAIYFKGKWKYQFEKAATADRTFTRSNGTTITVKSMKQSEKHKVFQGNGYVIAEIPYGQGNFVMDILLPDGNNLSSFYSLLTDNNYAGWINSLAERKVNLYLPRFKYGYKKTLKEVLTSMGMGIGFTDDADFSNISDLDLLINEVTHQAFIETNEEGTEAAAATVVDIGVTSIGPDTPITIDVNRPFIYIIREVTTNTVIFMGKVNDPLAE